MLFIIFLLFTQIQIAVSDQTIDIQTNKCNNLDIEINGNANFSFVILNINTGIYGYAYYNITKLNVELQLDTEVNYRLFILANNNTAINYSINSYCYNKITTSLLTIPGLVMFACLCACGKIACDRRKK
jgi:hypothetical protein